MVPGFERLIPRNPNRWGMRGSWRAINATAAEAKAVQPTPLTARGLEGLLRLEGTESFARERRVSRMVFIPREDRAQTVTVDFHSAAARGQIVLLEATPSAIEGSLNITLSLLNRDGIITEITTGESMDYSTLLARLKDLPQLRSASRQRHF